MKNIVNNGLQLIENNMDSSLNVHGEGEMICKHATEVGAQQTQHNRFGVIVKCRGKSYNDTGSGHCLSQIHSEILVHDLDNDIQTAGRSITREQNGKGYTNDQNLPDYIQKRILCDRVEIGKDSLKDTHITGSRMEQYTVFAPNSGPTRTNLMIRKHTFMINVIVETEIGTKLLRTKASAAPLSTETCPAA